MTDETLSIARIREALSKLKNWKYEERQAESYKKSYNSYLKELTKEEQKIIKLVEKGVK